MRRPGRVALDRALSKLGVLSRSEARARVLAGRVRVNGEIVRSPTHLVEPERARILVDGARVVRAPWRTLVLNKPRGTLTTRRDPEGRPNVFDLLGDAAADGIDRLRASRVTIRKRSKRETHLLVELTEGKNREIRRLCEAVGHEVTALKRIAFGGLELGSLRPGEWREVTRQELAAAFGRAAVRPVR